MYETMWKQSIEQFEDQMQTWMHDSTKTMNPGPGNAYTEIHPHLDILPSGGAMLIPSPTQGNWGFSPSDMNIFQTTPRVPGESFHNKHTKHHKAPSAGKWQSGGKGKAEGASGIGKLPKLGNVPFTTTPASGSSTPTGSPIFLVLMIGGGVLAVYFIWHKLRKSKAEDKEMDEKGE